MALARLADETTLLPPLEMVALIATPPDDATSSPPLETLVALTMAPPSTMRVPDERTMTPELVPELTVRVWPLLTMFAEVQPMAAMLVTSAEVRAFRTPLRLALLKASLPACVSQSPRSP